ncbi:Threonylcarbamoyl-AMP synthase [Fundidesulfovibrio magnetotacticus]|uniref:L-threonylcarbamoyladenylate synthase n=1 Tax=Fundidesulfovibrio magnetotacticus TaxID=2730080 RepID=A0A6V8LU88_9BACT|nr:Threonylcarbamoyl-AMP synthase [Fundidesulfovibrio magnetotacticus]
MGSAKALERVNAIKCRPRSKPLPVIIGAMSQLEGVLSPDASSWTGYGAARALMERFWPGPLSIIVPARADLPPQIKDARGFVSVRFTPNAEAQALCLMAGSPLAATSANVSGDPAVNEVGGLSPAVCLGADYVFQGAPEPAGGMPSTVVCPSGDGELVLFREGAVDAAVLEAQGYRLVRHG